ncbi:type II toxin-antitoxin system VapC family toxin [Methylocaldum sp.]|uniref:type II toxin-antitoxin system VapC family toxin n=1 Tax=Methylocaldum sp. TaxID=1969727 RepID=UPI002D37750F|nr:PIN domain nuclease [Methylocaldum sp.]HYE35211.1 PIN domain nuclease [Methylocaldum sp.]
MYLVDTSVWIDLLRRNETRAVEQFHRILERGVPYGLCSLIYQEVLQGARRNEDFERLQDYLSSQRFYHPKDTISTYAEAARIYFRCRREGITIRSTTDCLIAQIAIEHDLILLNNDRDFEQIAKVVKDLNLA